jgi:hypothetical protein
MPDQPLPLPAGVRDTLIQRIAGRYDVSTERATAMLDDAWKHGKDSAYADHVWQVLGRMLRPVIDEVAAVNELPDPHSPDSVARIVAAAAAAIPGLGSPAVKPPTS